MSRKIITSLIFVFILNLNVFAQTREVPKGWKEIKECAVSFLVPKSMKKMRLKETPIDSCFARYKSSTMTLGFSNDNYMPQPEETSYESLEIDGYEARLVSNPNYLRVYIKSGEGENARFFFGMSVSLKKAADAQTARQILQSIRFVNE